MRKRFSGWLSRTRRCGLRLIALLAGLCLGLVVCELVARRIPLKSPYRLSHPLFTTGRKPANREHYHDYDYPRRKAPGEFRIIAVGDSFTEGMSVNLDDTYPKRLERYLNCFDNDKGTRYSVLNMSRAGRSTPRELQVVKKEAYLYEPDLIIIGYCLNDAEDWGNPKKLMKLRKDCCYMHFEKPEGFGGFLYDRSALARLIFHRLYNTRSRRGYRRYYRCLYADNYSGWRKTRDALKELGEFSRSRHIPAGVVIFPLFSFGLGDDYPFRYIHEALHRALKEAGLPYLDLFSYYRNMDHTRLEAVPGRNPHPSEIAHRIAAEALWVNMLGSGYLPTTLKRLRHRVVYPRVPHDAPWRPEAHRDRTG